jgi:hypothetical protein
MKACAFALCCGVAIASISAVEQGMAQSAGPAVQVIAISGGAYVLPRQAGSKDAPGVFFAAPPSASGKGFPEKEMTGAVKQVEISASQRGR